MRDLLAQDVVGGQPVGTEIVRLFQSPIECRDRIGGIRAKEAAPKVAFNIACDDRVESLSLAVSAVNVAIAQGAAFQHAELVEEEVRVIAIAVEMPPPCGAFLIAMGRPGRAVHV
ncbi:MAG: hypothetical protein ACI8TF_002538 [Paracoccaceae bacterium]|jgi:hypothetical protein